MDLSIRTAIMADHEKICDLVWRYAHKFAVGKPRFETMSASIANLINDSDSEIFVCVGNRNSEAPDGEIRAAGGASLSPDAMSGNLLAYGLWLVSIEPRQGFAVARYMIAWAKSKNAVPVCSADAKMSNFYQKLGLMPREVVFVGNCNG